MMRRLLLTGLAAALVGGTGCRHFCRKCSTPDYVPPPPSVVPGGLGDPVPSRGRIPPPSVPTAPSDALPPPVIPDTRGSFFRSDPGPSPGSWVPPTNSHSAFGPGLLPPTVPAPMAPKRSDSNKELLLPDPVLGGKAPATIELPGEKQADVRGYLGEPVRPISGTDLPPGAETKPPTVAPEKMPASAGSPVGLPGFAKVPGRDGVAAGGKPTLDGFDWLKANRYRTVVYLHAPGSSPSAARELAEGRGLRFVPVAVSPATLAKAFDEFRTAVADASLRPVYVADEDGKRAGGLWYLLFRTADLMSDDAARVRAAPLGLTEATTEEQKQLWLAIQAYLANR